MALNHGSLLHWGARKQKSVKIPATPPALSSPEAEFVAASDCSRQIVWFCGLLTELQVMDTSVPPLLEMDNQGAIQLSSTTAFLERTKHIKIKFHHVRALHLSGELEVRYIQTDLNTADCMTKPLDAVKFNRHVFGHQGSRHALILLQPDRVHGRASQRVPSRRYVTSSQLFDQVYKLIFVPASPFRTRFITALSHRNSPFMSTK